MSTISVTVDHPNQALMLADWLKSIRFVRKVNIQADERPKGNVEAVQKMLDAIKSRHLFANITDPIAYQKQLRNEWERR